MGEEEKSDSFDIGEGVQTVTSIDSETSTEEIKKAEQAKRLEKEEQVLTAVLKAGFLTRDSRVVERKKPGKVKARKSLKWVKR